MRGTRWWSSTSRGGRRSWRSWIAGATRGRRRIGFLPENPYVYPYLTPREFVDLCGRLSGMRGEALRKRTMVVLEQVKIAYAADRQVRRLSKGMLQRTGLAAALVADPEMLILDEPMSGLDPVGRKEVRDLIFAERDQGRTIFFSTHILSDIEAMCDRVAILREGKVIVSGARRWRTSSCAGRCRGLKAHEAVNEGTFSSTQTEAEEQAAASQAPGSRGTRARQRGALMW